MKKKVVKDLQAATLRINQGLLTLIHTALCEKYPRHRFTLRPNTIALEGKVWSYLVYAIPVSGNKVVHCIDDKDGTYLKFDRLEYQEDQDLPIPLIGAGYEEFDPLKGVPTEWPEAPETAREDCSPTLEFMQAIEKALSERKDELLEGFIAAMWESHQSEIDGLHGGDNTCSYCDLMRTAADILHIEHPNLASHADVPHGATYDNGVADEGDAK